MQSHPKPNELLNITLLTTSFPRYEGDFAGHFVYQYAQQLDCLGCKVKVLAPQDSERALPGEWCNVKVEYFQYFLPQNFQTLAYGAGMISRIKQNPLRLLLIPFFLASFFFTALKAGKASDVLQAYWLPAGLVALGVQRFTRVPVAINLWGSDFLFLQIPGFSFICSKLLRRADAIICESDHFKDRLQQFGVPGDKISVLANGIDLKNFKIRDKPSARRQLDLPENRTIILTVGGMSPVKGQRYLIEAIPEIIAKDPNVQFIFVGDGEMRNKLESLVSAGKLNPYVLFAGMQKASQIPLWLNAADILVLPSLSEGNPNVLLEAMASGLAVVASSVGGIPHMIRDGREGLLVPPKSPQALAGKIIPLIRDKALREKLGQNGLKTARANYATWEKQSAKLKTIYNALNEKAN